MTANKHTPFLSNEQVQTLNEKYGWFKHGDAQSDVSRAFANDAVAAYERVRSAAPELLEALIRAQDFIDTIRQELHQRRVADWYPEGAHNAAEQMSDDMRLLGNSCADFDVSAAIAKATGGAS